MLLWPSESNGLCTLKLVTSFDRNSLSVRSPVATEHGDKALY